MDMYIAFSTYNSEYHVSGNGFLLWSSNSGVPTKTWFCTTSIEYGEMVRFVALGSSDVWETTPVMHLAVFAKTATKHEAASHRLQVS